MVVARDWLNSLWRTSFKGVPFWVETDTASGGRRLVVHEFPNRDIPFVEDLGERFHEFTVTAYVASDQADSEASAIMAICATRGAGILVLPTIGPVLVKCAEFNRKHSKDKLGYTAHDLKFIRDGFSSAIVTVSSLLNFVFIQASALTSVISQSFVKSTSIKAVPDYVSNASQTGLENNLSILDSARVSKAVDTTVSATQRDAIKFEYNSLPEVISSEDDSRLEQSATAIINIASEMMKGMQPTAALETLRSFIEMTPLAKPLDISLKSSWRVQLSGNEQATYTLFRLASLKAYCENVARVRLDDRQSAISFRANVASFFDEQLEALSPDEFELYVAMIKLRDATIEYLSRNIINLAPVVKIEANRVMPSLFWAWRLYADPNRSQQIVSRNKVPHPSFIPAKFEALSK